MYFSSARVSSFHSAKQSSIQMQLMMGTFHLRALAVLLPLALFGQKGRGANEVQLLRVIWIKGVPCRNNDRIPGRQRWRESAAQDRNKPFDVIARFAGIVRHGSHLRVSDQIRES